MGEKDDTKKEAAEKKPADAAGEKKPDAGPVTVVLKLDLHCEGCAKKIKKSISQFEGVESVRADTAGNKLTVTGKVDPTRIKERVEFKTKKKVDILSPQPKKDEEKKDVLPEKKADDKKTDEKKADDKKPKEPQSSSVVLKIPLHCDGCIHKIKRTISKLDGVESVTTDAAKDLVTVNGTMNMKELVPQLKEKFKRKVDIVPPKKEEKGDDPNHDKKEKEGGGGGEKKEKEGGSGGGDAKAPGGGDAKAAGGGGGGDEKKKGIEVVNKFEYHGQNMNTYTMPPMYNPNYYNQDYAYGPSSSSSNGYVYQGYNNGYTMGYSHVPPPQPPPPMYINDPQGYQPDAGMFSDENPNACSLM